MAHGPNPSAEDLAEYMPMVQRVVGGLHRRMPPNVLREDLVAAGLVGLLDAFRRDTSRGPAFDSYACIRVRGAVVDELRAQDWLSCRARRWTKRGHGVGLHGRDVSADVDNLLDVQAPALTEQGGSPEDQTWARSCWVRIAHAMTKLPEREANILTWHYLKGASFQDIAVRLNLSRPRVSQLHSRALRTLREGVAS